MKPLLSLRRISKTFTLHQRAGLMLPVLRNVEFDLYPGECLVIEGASGSGKSTLLKLIYGSYRATTGSMHFDHDVARREGPPATHYASRGAIDIVRCPERELLALRRSSMAYVSQYLRVVPRVPTLDIVAEALHTGSGSTDADAARRAASGILQRMRLGSAHWSLPPATFSGGEQQRVNLARGLVSRKPLVLLDEPTAALDETNRVVVIEMIREARAAGAAVLGVFHDREVRDAVATRRLEITSIP